MQAARRSGAHHSPLLSADGRTLAIGIGDRAAEPRDTHSLWDAAGRRRIDPAMGGHEPRVLNAEFSPDGRVLAMSGFGGTVIL